MKRDVIIACDFENEIKLYDFLKNFKDDKPFLKIGMELFYGTGMKLVENLKQQGFKIFLDLKLHDIPNTVYHAIKNLAKVNIDMINVHSTGGIEMMKAAKKALVEKQSNAILLGVTQLTSIDQQILTNELLIEKKINDVICSYAKNAKIAGCNGVVCSSLEAKNIKLFCGNDFLTVTPGIRFTEDSKDDQKRIATPMFAKNNGSDYIVVGRSITKAENPLISYKKALKEFI